MRGPERKILVLESAMSKKLIGFVALVVVVGAIGKMRAQMAAYPTAAPLEQYMIADKAAEIELAKSAAPAAISDGAEVLVLGKDGYSAAVKGGNGFTCLVERAWGKDTGDAEFWNPKVRAPHCMNAAAATTYLPIVLLKTRLVMAGKSKAEIGQAVKAALDGKDWPVVAPNAMCYMMSKEQYLSDDDKHWHPHMMWYVAGDSGKSWGANLAGVPVIAGNVPEDRMTVFMVVADHWSDGTPAMH